MTEPTESELVAIARRALAERGVSLDERSEHWFVGAPPKAVYVNDLRREDLAIGEVYTTWIVAFDEAGAVRTISHYRSRVCEGYDDTIPP